MNKADEELIQQVNAWRCRKCRSLIEGSIEEALKHAKVEAVKPLPVGYVYYIYDGENDPYMIIRSTSIVTLDHDSLSPGIAVASVDASGKNRGILSYIGSAKVSAREIRKWRYSCSDELLEEVKKAYERSSIKTMIGLSSRDLTNKLD